MSVLKIENLNLERSNDKSVLINDITLEIKTGEVVLLAGRNGVGKTTFINSMLGNMVCDRAGYAQLSGKFEVTGGMPDEKLFERVIYIPQNDYISFPFVKVHSALLDGCPTLGKKRIEYVNNWLEKYSPFTKDDKEKKLLNRRVGKLSGGEKKYVAIVQSLLRCDDENIQLIILDEPINCLDANHVRMLSNLLLKIKCNNPLLSFLIVSHCHAFPYVSTIYEIKDSKLCKGSYCRGTCFGDVDDSGFYEV